MAKRRFRIKATLGRDSVIAYIVAAAAVGGLAVSVLARFHA
jgi:hypothetical protein